MFLHKAIIIGGSRTAATSKMEHFLITVNDFQPLTIITKCSCLDVAAVLDLPLIIYYLITLAAFKFWLTGDITNTVLA